MKIPPIPPATIDTGVINMKKEETMEVVAQVTIKIPNVPNHIIIVKKNGDNDLSMSVGSFSDQELQNVANKWRDNLLANAERQRLNETAK